MSEMNAATHHYSKSATVALHEFALAVEQEASALSKSRRLECAVPKGSATSWPERERFLELLSPRARRACAVVLPSPKREPYTWRVADATPGASAKREQERRARAFRRRSLAHFGGMPQAAKPEGRGSASTPWPPDGSDIAHLEGLPAPRLPSADLEWRLCEAPALLGARSAGGFERGGSSNPADTWPMHQAMLQTAGYAGGRGPVARARRIDAVWRQLPTWAQDVIVVYYSTDRLESGLERTREGAPHKRAHALQAMGEAARLAKVGAWLRSCGIRGVSAEDAVRSAHQAWEHLRGAEGRKRRETAAQAAKRERDEAVAAFARELG